MFKTSTPLKTNISPENSWLEDYTFLLKMVPFKRTSKLRRGEPAVLLILHPNIQPVKDSVWSGVGALRVLWCPRARTTFCLGGCPNEDGAKKCRAYSRWVTLWAPGWLFAVYIGDYNKPFKVIIRIPISQSVQFNVIRDLDVAQAFSLWFHAGPESPKSNVVFRKFQETVGYHKLICWDIFVGMFMLGYFYVGCEIFFQHWFWSSIFGSLQICHPHKDGFPGFFPPGDDSQHSNQLGRILATSTRYHMNIMVLTCVFPFSARFELTK